MARVRRGLERKRRRRKVRSEGKLEDERRKERKHCMTALMKGCQGRMRSERLLSLESLWPKRMKGADSEEWAFQEPLASKVNRLAYSMSSWVR